MQNQFADSQIQTQVAPPIHWGHFGAIMMVMVLVLGMSWMEKPDLFSFKKNIAADDQNVPHYYAYVQPTQDTQPQVLGANTNPGPSIINDDGTVSPVDAGMVLAASTQDVRLSPDQIKVNSISDSTDAIQKYLVNVQAIEKGPIDNTAFETALSSNNQDLINQQAGKLIAVRDELLKLSVPQGLVLWHQLNVIQYNSAISILQNFTQADTNPELVAQSLGQFLKSQEDLQNQSQAVATKFNLDPSQLTAGIINVSQAGASQDGAPSANGQ
jgi:hypothetical protein